VRVCRRWEGRATPAARPTLGSPGSHAARRTTQVPSRITMRGHSTQHAAETEDCTLPCSKLGHPCVSGPIRASGVVMAVPITQVDHAGLLLLARIEGSSRGRGFHAVAFSHRRRRRQIIPSALREEGLWMLWNEGPVAALSKSAGRSGGSPMAILRMGLEIRF
jgi:hypothetical protein